MNIEVEISGDRLDSFLARYLDVSRNQVISCIRQGMVTVNDQAVKPSHKLTAGDLIHCPEILTPEKKTIQAENIPLSIIYEDDHLLIVDKIAGMTTHPSIHQSSGTLVNALMAHCATLSDTNGIDRPGIVHRLDRDTSGLIVAVKHNRAHQYMAELFTKRKIEKNYLALCDGFFPDLKARIELPIAKYPEKSSMKVSSRGKVAVTEVTVLERIREHTLLSVLIHTGRTHQIRVHLSHLGYPVCSDPIYGNQPAHTSRMMLHAWKLSFIPYAQNEIQTFIAPIPKDVENYIESLR